jgi:hypothetical protein
LIGNIQNRRIHGAKDGGGNTVDERNWIWGFFGG